MSSVFNQSLSAFQNLSVNVKQICDAWCDFGIHLFSYRKTFHDGSRINVSNDPHWLRDYYLLDLYRSSLFELPIESYETGFSLWPQSSALPVFLHGREYYNSDHGITYVKKHADYCEFFIFGAHKDNAKMVNVYINNLDFIKNFAENFVERAEPFITAVEYLPIQFRLPNNTTMNCVYSSAEKNISPFLPALSPREKMCIKEMLAGKTAKMIARELQLSFRTIEFYIDNIKRKTGCRTRFELTQKFLGRM